MPLSAIHLTRWSRWGASDPDVVMIHGSAQGSAVGGDRHFSAQSRLAIQGWSVTVPDRPGHGRSPSPGRPDDSEADGQWVVELLGEGSHLVGHSFGGCVALAAAAMRPKSVRLAMGDPRLKDFMAGIMAVHAGSPTAAEVAARFLKVVNVPSDVRGSSSPEELERMGEGIRRLKLPSPDALRAGLAAVKAEGVPTLVVTGGWSPAFEAVGDIVAALAGGERVVIPCEHHLTQLAGDAFNARLAAHMTQADAR